MSVRPDLDLCDLGVDLDRKRQGRPFPPPALPDSCPSSAEKQGRCISIETTRAMLRRWVGLRQAMLRQWVGVANAEVMGWGGQC